MLVLGTAHLRYVRPAIAAKLRFLRPPAEPVLIRMTSTEIQVFHVTPVDDRKLLSQCLHGWLGKAWNQSRRVVEAQRVQINGNLCTDESKRLNVGDVVRVLPHPQSPQPRIKDVKLHFLDEHLAVVEKPAGMTSLREKHDKEGHRRDRLPTLDEILPKVMIGAYEKKGLKHIRLPRVFPVHRLDRETSGLMVFARTKITEQHLSSQFLQHAIQRKYLALVHGNCEAQRIETHIARDRGDGIRGSVEKTEETEHAVTHVRPLETIRDFTLLECQLETGRTHQIRIHLAEIGHTVCGEKIYRGLLGQPLVEDKSKAPRLFLHAAELGFNHPITGERLDFEMPLPDDLSDYINRLRGRRPSMQRDRRR